MTNQVSDTYKSPPTFQEELRQVINRHSKEGGSDTPDYILAKYLEDCLTAYNRTVQARESWFGR